jgi:hypothetical protein
VKARCTLRNLHAVLTWAWVVLAVPSILWWSHSVPWLVLVSVYANVAGHWGAWQGARAEDAASGSDPC